MGSKLQPTLLFDYPTIGDLVDHLSGLVPATIWTGPIPGTGKQCLTQSGLENLSDKEAEALLLEELKSIRNDH